MPIRVAHLSQSDLSGGAAISAYRLHRGLLGEQVDSWMMVHHRVSDDPEVVRLPSWHRIWRRVRQELEGRAARELNRNPDYCAWSLPLLPGFTGPVIGKLKPDVINLHAVDGICAPWDIGQLKSPVVWTVHDEWAASAGFHFWVPRDEHFLEAGPLEKEFSGRPQRMLRSKLRHWKDKDLVIVSPSRWLAGVMASAPHFAGTRIEVIPYGIEAPTTALDSGIWRARHGVSATAKVVGYGAAACLNNFRKGDDLFFAALKELAGARNPTEIVVALFGDQPEVGLPELPFRVIRAGSLHERESIRALYRVMDCFVCPSRSDNLPNTILEAFAEGTPCAGFRIGGVPDMITEGETGFLATPFSPASLASAIQAVLNYPNLAEMREKVRARFTQDYTLDRQAVRYLSLYQELVER